jgi:hypothetical protein
MSQAMWAQFLYTAQADQHRWQNQVELLTIQAKIIDDQLTIAQQKVADAEYRVRSARQALA